MSNDYALMEAAMELEPQAQADVAYHAPGTLEEAERLKEKFPGYQYLGGGTILNWRGAPRVKGLIDLNQLALGEIEVRPSQIAIGATATIQNVAEHAGLVTPLSQAAGLFSSRNVRNMATVGGTATGKFFVSDLLPVLLAYSAEVEYFQGKKTSILPLAKWLQGRPGIICAVILRQLQRNVAFKQEKISKIDFPLIVTSVGWELTKGQIQHPVIAISGSSGKIALSPSGTACLAGKSPSSIDIEELNAAVQQDIQPTATIKATSRVKRQVIDSHLRGIIAELQEEGTL